MINKNRILDILRDVKNYAISNQKYELAAALRDTERLVQIGEIDKFDLEFKCEKLIDRFPDIEGYLSPLLVRKNRREKLEKIFGKD